MFEKSCSPQTHTRTSREGSTLYRTAIVRKYVIDEVNLHLIRDAKDHEALLIQAADGKIRADEQGLFPEIAEAQKPRSDSGSAQKQDSHYPDGAETCE